MFTERSSMSEEHKRRLQLLLAFSLCTSFLLVILLYPEFVVFSRFMPAKCTTMTKAPFRFYESQAKVTNNVTVLSSDGKSLFSFMASACNPMDCRVNGGAFMDKKEWLEMYTEGVTYDCLYDPRRDDGGFRWVVLSPVVYTVALWLILVICIMIGFASCIASIYHYLLNSGLCAHGVSTWFVETWSIARGAVARRAHVLHSKAALLWPWKRRRRATMEMTTGILLSSESLQPPAYEGPPPSYDDFAISDNENESDRR